MRSCRKTYAVLLCLSSSWAASAPAQTGAEKRGGLSANVELVSDYRFRGVSLSNRKPALQAGMEYEHQSGFLFGGWGSNIAENEGADIELDLYAGYSGSAAGVAYSVTAFKYFYPGASRLNYVELQSKVAAPLGPAHGWLELAFTPSQRNADQNIYTAAGISYDGPYDVTFHAKGGRENGAYRSKWDYEVGLTRSIQRVSLRAAFVTTNRRAARLGKEGSPGFFFGAGLDF